MFENSIASSKYHASIDIDIDAKLKECWYLIQYDEYEYAYDEAIMCVILCEHDVTVPDLTYNAPRLPVSSISEFLNSILHFRSHVIKKFISRWFW